MGKIIGLSGLISASGEKKKKGSAAKSSTSASRSKSMGRKTGGYIKSGPGAKGIGGKGTKKALGRRPSPPISKPKPKGP